MAVDEDGHPVRGAGALPYMGSGQGVGDMSGVRFSRNLLEQPPSPQSKGNFMKSYEQLMADVQAGKITPDEGAIEVAKARAEARREQGRANLMKARAARKANQEARKNGRAVAMPQQGMSKSGRRKPDAGSAGVQGADQQRGVSPAGMSDVSRAGGNLNGGIPEIQPDLEAGASAIQPQLNPEQAQKVRAAIIIATQPFHVNVAQILNLPLIQREQILAELRNQLGALTTAAEERRQQETQEDLTRCTWCKNKFQNQIPFGIHQFEVNGQGSGQWRAITTCRNGNCIEKFNNAVERIHIDMKAERTA